MVLLLLTCAFWLVHESVIPFLLTLYHTVSLLLLLISYYFEGPFLGVLFLNLLRYI